MLSGRSGVPSTISHCLGSKSRSSATTCCTRQQVDDLQAAVLHAAPTKGATPLRLLSPAHARSESTHARELFSKMACGACVQHLCKPLLALLEPKETSQRTPTLILINTSFMPRSSLPLAELAQLLQLAQPELHLRSAAAPRAPGIGACEPATGCHGQPSLRRFRPIAFTTHRSPLHIGPSALGRHYCSNLQHYPVASMTLRQCRPHQAHLGTMLLK